MITIVNGSSRPTSSITVPGTSQAIASSAGASVTAANNHPGSHHTRRYRRRAADAAEATGTARTAVADRTPATARATTSGPLLSDLFRTGGAGSSAAAPSST